jgi:hypothetical protein
MTSRFLPLKVAITLYQLPLPLSLPPYFKSLQLPVCITAGVEQTVQSNLADSLIHKMILLERQVNAIFLNKRFPFLVRIAQNT